MDSAHQAVLLQRKIALEKLRNDLAAEKAAIAKRLKSEWELETLHHRWCGIVVEQLVSDVLALIVKHLELAKDMRAFRLTCTRWDQSFCDNTQLFDNHFWVSRHTEKSCLVSHPFIKETLRDFGDLYTVPKQVSLFQSTEGNANRRRFECDQARYWEMKDGGWMKLEGNKMQCIGQYSTHLFVSVTSCAYARAKEDYPLYSGPTLEFNVWKYDGVSVDLYDPRHPDDRQHYDDHHGIPFPDPCQVDLTVVHQNVLRTIETAERITWYLSEEEMNALDDEMNGIAHSWLAAIVHRNNPNDRIIK